MISDEPSAARLPWLGVILSQDASTAATDQWKPGPLALIRKAIHGGLKGPPEEPAKAKEFGPSTVISPDCAVIGAPTGTVLSETSQIAGAAMSRATPTTTII